MKAIKFKNFTPTAFTWPYDGVPYTFEAGETIFLEDYKAYHFAKHLVDRELDKLGEPTSNVELRKKLGAKCFTVDTEEVTVAEGMGLNDEAQLAKKKTTKKKAVTEEEFTDLNEK